MTLFISGFYLINQLSLQSNFCVPINKKILCHWQRIFLLSEQKSYQSTLLSFAVQTSETTLFNVSRPPMITSLFCASTKTDWKLRTLKPACTIG
jgi:hypothetical protein